MINPSPAVLQASATDWSHVQFSSVQSFSPVWLFVTPWITALQASLSITNSRSLLKLMPIESVMPSSHLILCRPLLLLPSIFPSITVFTSESTLCIRWPKYWSFSFSSSPSHVSLITNALTGTNPTSQPLIHPWQRHFPPWEQCLDAHFYILASIKLLGGPQYSWTFQPSAFLIVTICFFFKFIWLHWVLVVMHGIFSLWHVTSSMWHVGPTCLPKDRTQIPGTGNYRTTREVSHHMLYILSSSLFHWKRRWEMSTVNYCSQ